MKRRNLLSLINIEAKAFLLKQESYTNMTLPSYFDFSELLSKVSNELNGKYLKGIWIKNPKIYDNLNYRLLSNKDGYYSWRPLQIIHPVMYVALVQDITNYKNWKVIKKRFGYLRGKSCVECISLPVVSDGNRSNRAEQIMNWWEEIEQKSLIL